MSNCINCKHGSFKRHDDIGVCTIDPEEPIVMKLPEDSCENYESPRKKIVFLTGAGISAESGIPTFRTGEDGLWEGHDPNVVCNYDSFEKNEEITYNFYNMLRKKYANCKPNKAHQLIAELEKDYDVEVITTNVDNFHEQAGSTKVLHLHGDFSKIQAMDDPTFVKEWPEGVELSPETVIEGHQMRPHIVMFGEGVPNINKAFDIVDSANIFVVVGTTLSVYPAASLLMDLKNDIPVYYIDPMPLHAPDWNSINIIADVATKGMEKLIKELYD